GAHSVARHRRAHRSATITTSARAWLTVLILSHRPGPPAAARALARHGPIFAPTSHGAPPRLVRLSPVELYAAYGSNMDPAQMALRCPHSPQRGTGWLEGWRLTFGGADIGWEGAMATVVEAEGKRVFVVLYEVTEQ